ncbi:MAG: mechanosensitive ion channel [Rudaea sp.]|uniref:mechanosensitive ion channel domain-containing protein n=1 Tax=unclassified Rudaea TaxID=2627037 RepID=UPI001484D67C|nr:MULTISPECIES: mechanosensitive ion channel domain-containing protein [unclassified Rudaea]MBN8887207.1 mechanosensitive ion channel [Rudaea sp.]
MPHSFAPFRALLILVLAAALAPSLPAATAQPAPAAQPGQDLPPPLDDAISNALAALPRARDLNADQRKKAEDLLRDAQADDQAASDAVARRQSLLDAALKAAPAETAPPASGSDNGQNFADWRAKLPSDEDSTQLSNLLEIERNQLGAAQASLRSLEEALQKQTQRPDTLRDELASVRAEQFSGASPTADTPRALATAMRLRAQAAERLQRCRIALLETEQRTYEPRIRTLFAQRTAARRSIDEHDQRVRWLENMVLDRYASKISDLVTQLAGERDKLEAAQAAPALREAAAENLALGQDLAATIKRNASLRELQSAYTTERSDTEQAAKNTKARLDLGGVSEDVGALLLAERRKLKPLNTLNRELADVRNELAQSKLAVLDLREEQDRLENMDGAIAAALARAGQPPAITGPLHDGLQRLLTTRGDLYTRLIASKTRQTSVAEDTEQQLTGLIKTTTELNGMLDSNLLAIPSHAPIGLAWFGELGHVLRNLAHPKEAAQIVGVADSVRTSGALPVAALLMVFAAVYARRRVPVEFERVAAPMRRIRTDRYRYTMWALALTALAAAPIALLWTILARLFLHTTHVDPLEGSLGLATGSIAVPWFVLAFLHWLNRENGLAHLHFRWLRARRAALRRAVPWIALAVLVPTFIHNWLREISNDEIDATIGRALFILGTLALSAIAWRLLGRGRIWAQRGGKLDDEPVRLRQLTRVAFSAGFIVLAVLAALGYFFTAIVIAEHLLMSLIAILAVCVVHGLAVRWLILGERRLALKRAEDRLLAEAEATGPPAEGETMPEVEPEEVAVADLGAQTRRVLRLAIALLLGATLLVIWSDIAPALSFLDNYRLWSSTFADENGKQVAFYVTLRSVLESALLLAMTFIATRNLPGLLEIGVLRRLNIDAPTRYAIVSIVRYLIVLIGCLVGISLLGVHWSNLQWLAAGLTVGLGFGLQEIFANFISGLIVLFERPCRVGDIITIGNIEGTVTRIRTRATTILDWDNKEVIVPNKAFITERLVNWTLSDTTTRVVVKVGIAYRNDPRLAQKLLLQVAGEHTLVLQDPQPVAWMIGFGDSTQDFELRFFVAEIGQRNLVRNELVMRIADVFRDHDIEIAYPTRDVWFRNPLETNAGAQRAPTADASSASKRD